MNLPRLTLFLFLASSGIAYGQTSSFDRFTDDLPKLLEADAVRVMGRGMTHEFASKICGRLGGEVAVTVEAEATEWRKRNDVFFRGAAAAINEFADRYLPVGGEKAKQGYFQSVLISTAKTANQRLMEQLNGANLDNKVLPPEAACAGLSRMLHDGVGDFENTPEVTRALVPYMQRKGIQ